MALPAATIVDTKGNVLLKYDKLDEANMLLTMFFKDDVIIISDRGYVVCKREIDMTRETIQITVI